DLIATKLPEVYWLEATDTQGNSWNAMPIGTIPPTSHGNGQGYAISQIVAGDKPEIVLASGEGIYYFEIPDNPSAGNWPRTHVTLEATEEGIGVGDLDGDGDIDLCAAVGTRGIAWWENPGNVTGNWVKYPIGTTQEWGDRFIMADINQDGRLDIVVSEETRLKGASVYWFEQPADPKSPDWIRHTVVTQYTTNSMDVADMDQDGDLDLVTAEHRGTKKVQIWENVTSGSFWIEHIVSTGKESHLGARVGDLDGDGDLEIVSIAWDVYQYLHVWRNDTRAKGTSIRISR
ncbi:MAG: VCBS repeat-containing protein, partial [Nitrospira sp.]|nr:VCBS repeat-containing protein [Nitrospira sp.]